ncbi:MAG: glycosyltransferase family 2 protein, partial [Mycoplasmataceae bacterium]|nr:glycosyltransferase family 2 protein [Mycoplasmataceae bacterium]
MKIAIIYHAYRNYLTLEESIKSFAKQTDADFEFILVNDGAINKTTKVLNKIDFSKFKNFKYYNFSQNVGHSFSFNTACNMVDADYVYYVGSNTKAKPDFIKQVKILLNKTKPDVLSMIHYQGKKNLQVFTKPDLQFKKYIGQSTRDKIFSIP